MKKINAYINFNGNCHEAMTFYKECLGGELTSMTVGRSPMADQMPASAHGNILHSELTLPYGVLMVSDMCGPEPFVPGNNFTLVLDCTTEDEIRSIFDKLSEGGEVRQPVGDAFWGGLFAFTKDKFGVSWMLNCSKEQE